MTDDLIDFSPDDLKGPTIGELERGKRTDDLMKQVLTALATPAAPAPVNVQVAAPEVQPAQVVFAPTKKTSWTFTFDRNPDGTIHKIHATPSSTPTA